MAKLPRLSGKEVIEIFKRDGWVVDRIEGSHHILVKSGHEATLSVPVHGRKEIKLGLLKRLIRDAGMTNKRFIELSQR